MFLKYLKKSYPINIFKYFKSTPGCNFLKQNMDQTDSPT